MTVSPAFASPSGQDMPAYPAVPSLAEPAGYPAQGTSSNLPGKTGEYTAAGPYPSIPGALGYPPTVAPYPAGKTYPGTGQVPQQQQQPPDSGLATWAPGQPPPWGAPGHHVMGFPVVLEDPGMTPEVMHGPYPGGPQHPGGVPYPGGAPFPGGQYPPPQSYPAGDVAPWDKPRHHVMGYPMVLQDATMTPQEIARERKGVLIGTMTLLFGLRLPLLWLIGGFLPCCFPRSKRVRCIALMNSLAFIITTLLVIILPVTLGRGNTNNTRYNNRYYYYYPPPPFQG